MCPDVIISHALQQEHQKDKRERCAYDYSQHEHLKIQKSYFFVTESV
jgi:hypothetical protein